MARDRLIAQIFDSSSDEEINEQMPVRRPRWIRERVDHFDDLDDKDFETRFRLSKRTCLYVLKLIEDQLEFPSERNNPVSPLNQLLCTFRFYATGSGADAGDFGGLSKSSAHRIIHRVSRAIAGLRRLHVSFPETPEQIRQTQTGFFGIASFPKAIGAIDCTHIRLQSPGGDNAEVFRNHKRYFSLNVQAICNSNLEFLDVVARWPGSVHDSFIFNSCYRHAQFEHGAYGGSVLLGDSGYACKSYMMTPLDNPVSPQEQLYNEAQMKTRNTIERTFGIWKRRFPALVLGFKVHYERTFPIIIATAVLHNILQHAEEELPPDDPTLHLPVPWEELLAQGDMGIQDQERQANRVQQRRENVNHQERHNLIENYFGSLVRGRA